MAQYVAKHQGHLEGYGLVCKGDVVEWTGSKRAWLEPVKGKQVDQSSLDRKQIMSELKARNVQFFKGADTEYLSALLITHKEAMK